MRRFVALIFSLGLVLGSSTAFAQNDPEKMQILAAQAIKDFQDGKYQEAAEGFRKAFEAYPDLNLKKNEMVAWFKADNCIDAIQAGERFEAEGNSEASDKRDLKNVRIRCDLRKAISQIDYGNLDVAKSMLVDAETKYGEVEPDDAKKIEDARARIEELEKEEVVDPPPTIVYRKPGWALITGAALTTVGTAGMIFVPTVWRGIERKQINERHYDKIAEANGDNCDFNASDNQFSAGCPEDEIKESVAWADAQSEAQRQDLIRAGVEIAAALGTAAGIGLLIYYFVSKGSPTEVESSVDVSVGPTIGKDRAGAQLLIRF